MNMTVEKGDIVALRDGRTVEVLSVKPDYEKQGAILRFDFIDRNERSPMRRTEYPSIIINILRKGKQAPDPKAVRPHDNRDSIQKVIVVDGKEYIQKDPGITGASPAAVLNQDAGPQVHPAVKAPVKPVLKRGKTDK